MGAHDDDATAAAGNPIGTPLVGRRQFLGLLGAGVAGAALGGPLAAAAGASTTPPPVVTPGDAYGPAFGPLLQPTSGSVVGGTSFRPPAVPLAVRDMYASSWLSGSQLTEHWAEGWNGPAMGMCGLVHIDGRCYVWCGAPGLPGVANMRQVGVEVTATRTIFTFEAAGVRLIAEWLSPIEPGNPRLQSVPLSLVTVTVAAIDGHYHGVHVYFDMSGQWASWRDSDEIVWQLDESAGTRHWSLELAHQEPLTEHDMMAAWGTAVLSTTPIGPGETYQCGYTRTIREQFARVGYLANTVDRRFRAIQNDWPAFGFAHFLGVVGKGAVTAHWSIGRFEGPQGLEYMGHVLTPLWQSYWRSWQGVVDSFLANSGQARDRAAALDARVTAAATQAGGSGYAALCALAARQAYGSCQLMRGPQGQPWAFLKELSSSYLTTSTVDVIFDSCPVWLYLDPGYLAMLLAPILAYAGTPAWDRDYPPHSLGLWPVADGNPPGPASEPMPVQEAGAMLVMAAAYSRRVSTDTAHAFLARDHRLWIRWAEFLTSQLPKPPSQLTTIDYLGPMTGDTNLAALGIVGLGAASQIAHRLGEGSYATSWENQAKKFAGEWASMAMDPSGAHLENLIGDPGTWSMLWNAYWDKVLATGLISAKIADVQASWYEAHTGTYGMGVSSVDPTLGRLDLQMWTAGWLQGTPASQKLLDGVVRYVSHTPYLEPLPDTYDTATGGPGTKHNWRARSVVGALFSLLLE